MAFYLTFDGSDDYVDLASPISAVGDGVLAEIDFVYKGASNDVICGGTSFSDFWRINNDAQFRISISGSASNVNITTPLASGTRYTLKLVRIGSSVVVEDDDGNLLTSSANFNANPFVIGKIGSFHNGSSNLAMDLYGFRANNGASSYNKQTLNGSNDTVLPDTVGGNDGTLVNFPTDNSQWVFFDDGGGTATLDANVTLPSLTATGSASATLPNPALSASITMPIITASGSASASLPQPTLSALVALPTITVNGSASATLPGFNLSGNITLPAITATGAAQATLPQPILTASVTLPTLTAIGSATATEPSFTLSGNVTLQTIVATGAASATLPQPTLSGNITLPSIQVSGFLVGGEIVITIDASTNINEPQLSTNITEPTLSTNISE